MDLATAINDLEQNGYFVWDGFLSIAEVEAVLVEFKALHASGQFKRAGVGKNKSVTDIRKDEIYWLDPLGLTPTQNLFLNRLEALKNEINQQVMLGLWALEGHYSHYPKGGFYHAHLDRFASDDTRTISMVLYLNAEWTESDGGELSIHREDKNNDTVDVLPVAGRLVCFLSARVLHEVRVTHRDRFSFAGWWKRRPA